MFTHILKKRQTKWFASLLAMAMAYDYEIMNYEIIMGPLVSWECLVAPETVTQIQQWILDRSSGIGSALDDLASDLVSQRIL